MEFKEIPFTHLLSNIVDNRGKTCPTTDIGMPLIATNCIRNDILYPVYEKIRFVSQETYKTWFRGHPQPGDMIFVTKGTPGRVCMVPNPVNFCIAQDMVAVRADEKKIYSRYLFAVLRSPKIQRHIENMHVGTLIPHFKKGDFDKLLIPVPDQKTQKVIGDIYFLLSCKIELNQQMNRNLEAIAQAIFKSWFVDFDPIHAKIGGGKSAGVDDATAALFPDSFEGSQMGEIPKGWKVGVFDDLIHILSGGTPKTSVPEYWDGDILWFSVKDTPADSDVFVINTEKRITRAGVEKSATQILPKGTTIITARGTVGKLALTGVEMAMNQSCFGIRGKNGYPDFFIYYQLHTVISELQRQTHGTVFDTINRKTFTTVKAFLPPVKIAQAFDHHVKAVMEKIQANLFESRTLAAIRDALLPKLMSGEIRVKDAEKIVEAAA